MSCLIKRLTANNYRVLPCAFEMSPTKRKSTTNSDSYSTAAEQKKKKLDSSSVATGQCWLFDHLDDDAWKTALQKEFTRDYMHKIAEFLKKNKKATIFPPTDLIFNALNTTSFDNVKVVLLGQDPYHDDGQAHGLSFSVPAGIKTPPSLKNMYKELQTDLGIEPASHGCLEEWARQGVLLLNATLTVEAHKANSHASLGWQRFTDHVISTINREQDGVAFLLFGRFAHQKAKLVNGSKHGIVMTAHPSPLSVKKFLGCKCFSQVNDYLKSVGKDPIDWTLPS